MSARWRLSLLTRVYAASPDSRVLDETLALIEAAEALGYHGAWVAQHHFGRESGRLPSPLVLLAAAARRTRRIALGSAVIVLPLETPLRLAEDAAVLDALSGGRLQLGFGAGFEREVFEAFGRDYDRRAQDQAASLDLLQRAFEGVPLGEGAATLQPPAPALPARIWLATGEAEAAARRGHGLIVARIREQAEADLIARYRNAWRQAAAPRVALARAVVPGAGRAAVEAALAPDILRYAARLAQANGTPPPAVTELPALLDRLGVLRGTPDEIAAALGADPALPGITELVVQVQTFGTPFAEALRRIESVARDVVPALGWAPAPAAAAASFHFDPLPT
ncbi:MAG: LLM class flavin-dependent oxidoreductase [Burkholderia gladioli]